MVEVTESQKAEKTEEGKDRSSNADTMDDEPERRPEDLRNEGNGMDVDDGKGENGESERKEGGDDDDAVEY